MAQRKSTHIYINNSSIEYNQYRRNKETGVRERTPYVHSRHVDKDGQPVRYCHIKIPSVHKRQKIHGDDAYIFGVDKKTGIDLDSRKAYIQIPVDELNNPSKMKIMKNGRAKTRVWYFNNENAEYKVYFSGVRQSNGTFDRPPVVKITNNELRAMYATTREELHKLRSGTISLDREQHKSKEITKDIQKEQKRSRNKDSRER